MDFKTYYTNDPYLLFHLSGDWKVKAQRVRKGVTIAEYLVELRLNSTLTDQVLFPGDTVYLNINYEVYECKVLR